MKKLKYMIFLFLYILLGIVSVEAATCPYQNIKYEDDKIITVISKEETQFNIDLETAYYGNMVGGPIGIAGGGTFFSDKNIEDAVTFLSERGEQCPDYFYIFSDSETKYGYFSDIEDETKIKNSAGRAASTIYKSIADEGTQDENGNLISSGEKYACSLDAIDFTFSTTVEIDYTGKDINFSTGTFEAKDDYMSKFDFETKEVCPSDLKVCKWRVADSASVTYYIADRSDVYYDSSDYACSDLVKTGDVEVGTKYCSLYVKYRESYNLKYENGKYTEANQDLDKLKTFCNLILSNSNYDSYKYSCINLCLNMSNDFGSIELEGDTCGFSQRLLAWIANIVRWIKYIIPVAVIVLGILDFIKAVGADKDDEMKKAQGRFVKRLIAAALIFIIPFIIEFVLDKMGFGEYISGCGIIDL